MVCKAEFPHLTDILNDYSNENYVYYALCLTQDWNTVQNLLNANPSWEATEWLHDPYPPSDAYVPILQLVGGTAGVPNHFIIDLDGNVRFNLKGGVGSNTAILTDVIDELL